MKLLYLCHRFPYPPQKGEKIRAWNILKFLAERHQISLACTTDDPTDLELLGQVRRYAREVLVQCIHRRLALVLALPSLLGAEPLTVSYFYSRALQQRIDALIDRDPIDGVLCSSSPMAAYIFRSRHLERLARTRRIMDLMDVDSHKWHQYAATSPFWTAWLYRREARRLGTFECRIAREFERVLLVSEEERRYFPDASAPNRLLAIPNGVDLEFFSPKGTAAPVTATPVLVFTGVMSYRPNIDGIVWFADRIFSRVRAAVPDVQLYVVGSQPIKQVVRLGERRGITVTGYVQDVRPYLARATVCIVPLRIARGIQNKVLEAMAMGRPVVVTRAAFEGIEADAGHDLLVADDEPSFAAAVIELLQDAKRRDEIGRNARACVESRYAWRKSLRRLDDLFPPSEDVSAAPTCTDLRTGASCAPSGASLPRPV